MRCVPVGLIGGRGDRNRYRGLLSIDEGRVVLEVNLGKGK